MSSPLLLLSFVAIAATAWAQSVDTSAVATPESASRQQVRITAVDDRTVELSVRFDSSPSFLADPDAAVPIVPGLVSLTVPGSNLIGYAREIALASATTDVAASDVVEVSAVGVRCSPVHDRTPANRDGTSTDDAVDDATASAVGGAAHAAGIVPKQWATIGTSGSVGSAGLSTIVFYPYRYDAARGVVEWARSITIRLHASGPLDTARLNDVRGALLQRRDRRDGAPDRSMRVLGTTASTTAPDGYEYKLITDTDGPYRVTAGELHSLGLPLDRIDASTLRLLCNGVEVPLYVWDNQDDRLGDDPGTEEYIEFFARRPRADTTAGSDLVFDPHTRFQTYFLTWGEGPGRRVVEEDGTVSDQQSGSYVDLTSPRSSYRTTLHVESDLVDAPDYNAGLNQYSDRRDQRVWTTIPAGNERLFEFTLPFPDPLSDDPVAVRLAVRGGSRPSGDPTVADDAHTVEVFLQGRRLAERSFVGDAIAYVTSGESNPPVATRALSRTCRLSVIDRDVAAQDVPPIAVNWFDVSYRRLYRTEGDRLDFTAPESSPRAYHRFRIRGFHSPHIEVFREGISRITNLTLVEPADTATVNADSLNADGYEAMFQVYVASPSERFVAIAEDSIPHPILMRDRAANLRDASNGADLVVIVDDASSGLDGIRPLPPSDALERFRRLKQQQGYRTMVVRATDIYDEFNGGRRSPWAIRSLFAYARHSWSTPPRYALIFSSGEPAPIDAHAASIDTTDPRLVAYRRERSYVPSIEFQTIDFGPTPCDWLLGCLDAGESSADRPAPADYVPEVVVGRVNVRSHHDIEAYVGKVEAQKAPASGPWSSRSLFVAGDQPSFTSELEGQVGRMYRYMSEPHRIYATRGYAGSRYDDPARLFDLFGGDGCGLVTYFGHGGGGQWEDVAQLNSTNVYRLRNIGHEATVLSYTCFTGTYVPERGLLSSLLIHPDGGAISALGTPGLGWLINNGLLADAVASVITDRRYRGLTFGDVVALGKARYLGAYGNAFPDQAPTIASMFSVFGDPTLRIPVQADTFALVHDASLSDGDTATVVGTLPFDAKEVAASWFDTTETTVAPLPVERIGSRVVIRAVSPDGSSQRYGGVRVRAVAGDGELAIGTVRIPTGEHAVSIVYPIGALSAGQPASFEVDHQGAAAPPGLIVTIDYEGAVSFTRRTLNLTDEGNGHYRSDTIDRRWIEPGARFVVEVKGADPGDGPTTFVFHAHGGADPAVYPQGAIDTSVREYDRPAEPLGIPSIDASMAVIPGGTQTMLSAWIYNWGDDVATDVPYAIEVDTGAGRRLIGSGTVSIPPRDSMRVEHAISGQPPVARRIILTLRPDSLDRWQDAWRHNDVGETVRSLAAAAFDSRGFRTGAESRSFVLPDVGRIDVDSVTADHAVVLTALLAARAPSAGQSWRLMTIGSATCSGRALELHCDSRDGAASRIQLDLAVDSVASVPGAFVRVVSFDSTTGLWLGYPTSVDHARRHVSATVPAAGTYAIALVDDAEGPRIRFAVEGQFFGDSSVVSPDARIGVVASDPSGIDASRDRVSVVLDGEALVRGVDYVVVDTTITSTAASLRIQRHLDGGYHTLRVSMTDRLGNSSESTTVLSVNETLDVRLYGNFPNPFGAETFIAYEITGSGLVDDVELTIFTTAGKPIRTFRYPSAVESESLPLMKGGTGIPIALGYHEAWWDGRDRDGVQVANGVYFYRLRVKLEDRVIEQMGTMARIR